MTATRIDRILGGLHGSLVGDALGVPVEFAPRSAREADPVTGMRAYGTHHQPAGTWSDDGALLLCSVESLVERGYDTQDMGERFVKWLDQGLWTAHGRVFDIGNATASALGQIRSGVPAEEAGGRGQYDNGNGSLMRILPVSLACAELDDELLSDRVQRASAITHGHDRSRLACVFHALFVSELLGGHPPQEALISCRRRFLALFAGHPEASVFQDWIPASLADRPCHEIRSDGYVIHTLTASLWCLLTTTSFSECVLKAVNLGDDTDTTGCVAGGLAGLLYGMDAIPPEWIAALPKRNDLDRLFGNFIPSLSLTP